MIRKLDDHVSVASQISPEDVPGIAAQGFVRVINNRPDGEEPDQPPDEAIRRAADRAGLDHVAIAIGGGYAMADVAAMAAALDSDGPVLAFCRSGTRSAHLWALARALRGDDPEDLIAKGAAAGYDLSGLAPTLARLSAEAGG